MNNISLNRDKTNLLEQADNLMVEKDYYGAYVIVIWNKETGETIDNYIYYQEDKRDSDFDELMNLIDNRENQTI